MGTVAVKSNITSVGLSLFLINFIFFDRIASYVTYYTNFNYNYIFIVLPFIFSSSLRAVDDADIMTFERAT